MDTNIHYSNKEYKRLGDRIRNNPQNISEDDLIILQELRLTYKEPLSIIFNSIEKKLPTGLIQIVYVHIE